MGVMKNCVRVRRYAAFTGNLWYLQFVTAQGVGARLHISALFHAFFSFPRVGPMSPVASPEGIALTRGDGSSESFGFSSEENPLSVIALSCLALKGFSSLRAEYGDWR